MSREMRLPSKFVRRGDDITATCAVRHMDVVDLTTLSVLYRMAEQQTEQTREGDRGGAPGLE